MKKSIFLEDGDIKLINGNIVLIGEDDRVLQLIENTLSIRKGEWFYNQNTGLNHDELFKKKPDLKALENDIIQTISSLDEVDKVISVEIEYNKIEREALIKLNISYNLKNIELEVTL